MADLRCDNCGNINEANRDYCRMCGHAISKFAKKRNEKCSYDDCTGENPINSNYCNTCGEPLNNFAKREREKMFVEKKLEKKDLKKKYKKCTEYIENANKQLDDKKKQIESKNRELKKLQERIKNKLDITFYDNKWVFPIFLSISLIFMIFLFIFNIN